MINIRHEQPLAVLERVGAEYRKNCRVLSLEDLAEGCFFGIAKIRVDDQTISSSVNLIPAIDFVRALDRLTRLADAEVGPYFSMDSTDEFWFRREGSQLVIWANTSDAVLRVGFDLFATEVERFTRRTVKSLVQEQPSLMENIPFRERFMSSF